MLPCMLAICLLQFFADVALLPFRHSAAEGAAAMPGMPPDKSHVAARVTAWGLSRHGTLSVFYRFIHYRSAAAAGAFCNDCVVCLMLGGAPLADIY